MSFEGYYQILCLNGHHVAEDAYSYLGDSWACPTCGAKAAWENLVDVTNGSYDDNGVRVDGFVELEVMEEGCACTCEKCGNVHYTSPIRYRVPEEKGRKIPLAGAGA